jgi:hypothetical protein
MDLIIAGEASSGGVTEYGNIGVMRAHFSMTPSLQLLNMATGRDYRALVDGRRSSGRSRAQDYAAISDRAGRWRICFEFRAAIAASEPESGRGVLFYSSGTDLSCGVVHTGA